jgi:TolB-like protein/DNA-binding winged helix-turn-helix (wHTH) protein/Tfp pilus assembly protein PilF
MSATSSQGLYRFATFTLDPRTGELTHSGNKVPLREQPLQLLLALLEKPGELVTREELVKRLWEEGTFTDVDRGLNKAVNHLREALGDSAEAPHFVETLPRKGYRFIAEVNNGETKTSPSSAATGEGVRRSWHKWVAVSALVACIILAVKFEVRQRLTRQWRTSPEISALAVIPLESLSVDPEQEYFADGITDALITDLAKRGNIRVTSRTSVIRYRKTRKSIGEIGRELNVDAIVEGTVTRSGNRIRVTAQLIQVATDMHLWADTYERDVSEILSLQNEIASDIARHIDVVLKPAEPAPAVNPRAYGLYLQGRYYFYQYTELGWQQAIDSFNQAISLEPNFALAYAGLADTYLVAGAYAAIPSEEALTRGKAAALKALALDDNLASAHYALATAYTWYDWDWNNAEKEFQRALSLNPNDALGRNWYGGYLSVCGRHDEAIDEHERARALDPSSLIINANLARALYWGRRYDEAISQAQKTLQIDPRFGVALFWLEGSLRHRGLFKQAVALRQSVVPPNKATEIEKTFRTSGFQALLRQSAESFQKNGAPFEAARCFAQIGEIDTALSLLEECLRKRCSSMVTLKAEPDFEVLQQNARFRSLLRGVGLL